MSRPLPCSRERLLEVAREFRVKTGDVEMEWGHPSLGREYPTSIEEAAKRAYEARKRVEMAARSIAERQMLAADALAKEFGFPVSAIWHEKRVGDWPDDRSAAEALRERADAATLQKAAHRQSRPWWLRWWPL